MGLAYRLKTGKEGIPTTNAEMRILCQRPGKKDENGKNIYTTQQHHKDQCDVNKIIKKYDKTGLIIHVAKIEAKYGEHTGADFKQAQDIVVGAMSMFEALPSNIRNRFRNSPYEFLKFMEDEKNRKEAIELGLISKYSKPEEDGIGEYVPDAVKKTDDYPDVKKDEKKAS